MTTRTLPTGSMNSKPTFVPAPDLLDLVSTHLPGESGIAVMYSITGSLSLRIARLAGMVANSLAADYRKLGENIDSYNDAMSHLEIVTNATKQFHEAGNDRIDMTESLTQLISYKHSADDYLATLVSASKMRVTNWADSLVMAAEPMPVDQWKLDMQWDTYLTQCAGKPKLTRAQYDVLTQRELTGGRATWASHVSAVINIIDVADNGYAIDFDDLDRRTQLSLLTSYATPERMARFNTSIIKRGRSAFQVDSEIRLHESFVQACVLALTHHRYASMEDNLGSNAYVPHRRAPEAESKEASRTVKQQVARAKERAKLGLKSDLILTVHNPETVAIEKLRLAKATPLVAKPEPLPRKPKVVGTQLADLGVALKDMVSDKV